MSFYFDVCLKLEVVGCIGMAVPFSCARLLVTCRGGRAMLPLLKERPKYSAWQAAFQVALHRCLRTWTNRGNYLTPETLMQELGVAIAHDADEELVFAFLAAIDFQVQLGETSSDDDEDELCDWCPYAFRGPFGSPLFAASTRNSTVTAIILRCRADPCRNHFVKGDYGDGDIEAWEAETPLHAAVRDGADSTVELLLHHGGKSIVRALQQPGYERHGRGIAVHQ